MDSLAAMGTAIGDVVFPTYKAYEPLLQRNAEKIKSTSRHTFSYGSHPRQKLDVYSPSAKASDELKNSIFIFLYGGGLVRGDKVNAGFADGLVYTNLGHFFSETLGIPVVVVDYRLLSHGAVYPSGGEDLALALDWVEQHFNEDKSKTLDLFIMGNSAGGIHLSTFLLAPEFAENRRRLTNPSVTGANLKGAVLLAVPFHFDHADASRKEVIDMYFKKDCVSLCPFGLLKTGLQNDSVTDLSRLPVLALTASLDPEDEILVPGKDFFTLWESSKSLAPQLKAASVKGHNHISPVLSLGTGIDIEEAWAQEVIGFMKSTLSRQ